MGAIGDNIKFLREHHKFSPAAVAKKLNINVQDYNAWENGLLLPTIDKVMSLCAIYKVKSPTDLFSDSFIQRYNAKEVKSLREAAIKKAQDEANFNGETETKLNFVIPNGSYYNKPLFFGISIALCFVLLLGFFLPCFSVDGKSYIGYVCFKYDLVSSILIYVSTVLTLLFAIIALRFNYKVVYHNEFFPKEMATKMKVTYLLFSFLIMGINGALFVLNSKNYDVGIAVQVAVAICLFISSMFALTTIKASKPDSITYSYVMKFSKYKIRSDAPKRALKGFAVTGIIFALLGVAYVALEILMKGGILGLIGVKKGIIYNILNAIPTTFNAINTSIGVIVAMGVSFAIFVYLQFADIMVCGTIKKQYENGLVKSEDAHSVKKTLVINLILGIISYVVMFATVLIGLVSSADTRLLAAKNYLLPILTLISVLIVIRLSLYIKAYFAYRGAETVEVTGFSEVQLDERKHKKSKKSSDSEPKQDKSDEKKEKPKKKSKKGGEDEGGSEQPAPQPTESVAQPVVQPAPSQPTPPQPAPAPAPQPAANTTSDNKGGNA